MIYLKNKIILGIILFLLPNIIILSDDNYDAYNFYEDDNPPSPISYYKENQWNQNSNWYSYIKQGGTKLYEESRNDSTVLKVFNKYDMIYVILRKKVKGEIWGFVGIYDDNGDYLIYGWLKTNQVLFKSNFKPVNNFKYKEIRLDPELEGNQFIFSFKKNGEFKYVFNQYVIDKISNKINIQPYFTIKLNGHVEKYNELYWFKTYSNNKKEKLYESIKIFKFKDNKIYDIRDLDYSNSLNYKYVLY